MSSSSRGRGRAAKTFVPNLAAAGRRSDKTKVDPIPSTSNGTKLDQNIRDASRGHIGRGGRGRGGRGRSSYNDKPKYVKSEGIFSGGITANTTLIPPVKKLGDETIVGSVNTSNSINVKIEVGTGKTTDNERPDETKSTPATIDRHEKISSYEEHWQSDDEQDNEALAGLLYRESIIADLKKTTRLPIVVPTKDAGQFHGLLDSKIELEETKVFKRTQMADFVQQSLTVNDGSVMLMQIPASIANIAKEAERSMFGLEPSTSIATGSNTPTIPKPNLETEWDDPPEPEKPKHCLSGFPKSVQIGKMKVRRSGHTTLEIAGQEFNLDEATLTNYFESAARINTARNTFYHLGEVKQFILCSYDCQRVLATDSAPIETNTELVASAQEKTAENEASKKRRRAQ